MNFEITLVFLLSIVAVIFNIFIALYFLLDKNKDKRGRILLFCMYTSFGLWGVTQVVNYMFPADPNTIWSMRLGYAFVPFAITSFYYYVTSYALLHKAKIKKFIILLIVFIVLLITLSPLIIYDVKIEDGFVIPKTNLLFAIIYTLIVLFFAGKLVYRIFHTFKTTRNAAIKNSMYLLAISVILTAIGAIVFNLIIPNVGNNAPKTAPLMGFISSLLLSATSSYIFSRTRFSHIKKYIKEIVYYSFLALIAYLTFHLVYIIQIALWGDIYVTDALISGVIYSFVFIWLINNFFSKALARYTSKITDLKYLNTEEVKQEFINQISEINTYKNVFKSLKSLISDTIPDGKKFILYVKNDHDHVFFGDDKEDKETIEEIISDINKLEVENDLIVISERIINSNMHSYSSQKVIKNLKKRNIEIIQPLKDQGKSIGYLILFQKPGLKIFFKEELNFIKEIASIVILALSKVQLYKKERNFALELQSKVDEQTKELKEKTSELEEKVEALEDARRRERDMLDILGHELRTPLTTARNAVSFLKSLVKKGKVDPEKIEVYLGKAQENLDREGNLLETMLSTTKIDNEKLELYIEKVDMIDVVNDSLDGLGGKAKAKNLEVKINKPGECFGYADRQRIQQVVDNIISNAIKYTNEGFVEITLENLSQDKTGQAMVKLSVKDTGEGMSEKAKQNLGKKFYRANNYVNVGEDTGMRVVRAGGTGLGLYVTFSLVKMMEGRIEVESEVGVGSEFKIYIPQYTGQKPKGKKKQTVAEKFAQKMKSASSK